MNGKRFLLLFFGTAILVAGLAAWLGMKGLAARDVIKAREAAQSRTSQPASSPAEP